MRILQALRMILTTTVVGTVIGAVVGSSLATFNPGYYRACYPMVDEGSVSPLEVGLGLGISQGMIAGTLVGAVLVFAVAVSRMNQPPRTNSSPPSSSSD